MKYHICYQEEISHYQDLYANDQFEAMDKLWDMIDKKTTDDKLIGNRHRIINIRAENGDEFTFFDDLKGLTQWRWKGKGYSEAKALGLVKDEKRNE